jgi:hypothetical protein
MQVVVGFVYSKQVEIARDESQGKEPGKWNKNKVFHPLSNRRTHVILYNFT